jgi:hypothetical protein
MKRLFAIIYFLIPVCLHAQVDTAAYAHPVIHVTNPHYITSWSQLGSFDTCVVKAGTNLGGGYLHGGGTASHHWVLINEGGFINMNGIELDDVKYFDILCIGSNDEFGCIMDASHNGFALPIEGKSDSITIEGMLINGGINEGITAKIEAPDYQFKYHCNTSYATWVQNHITIKFCKFRYNGGESVYANSTGWNKRDNVTCPIGVGGSDSTYKFAVPPSDYIVVDSNIFIGPGRSAVNFSNLSHGEFIGNKGWHIGRELNIAQGRLLACGGAVIDPVVKNNKNSGSFNNAFWFASEGTIDFENNTWDSAGYYGTFKNTDETPGVVFGVTDRTVRPGAVTWKICNNTGAHANNGIEFGLYPGFQNTTTGNYFGGNTGAHVIDNSFPFVYSTNCGSSNIPPVVNAGADVSITLPTTTVNLSGTATDADGTIASHTWTNTDGCSITSASSLTTTATCSTAGDHVFTLSATDNSGATSTDDLTATVISGANTPPVAIASTDNIIFLPVDSVILNQSGTDADGTIISYQSKLISSYFSPRFKYGNTQHPVLKGLNCGRYNFDLAACTG